MLKKVLGLFLVVSCALPGSALADDTSATPTPQPPPAQVTPVTTLKPITVVGRTQLPIVIELKRLSAAHEAGVAHEALHNALVAQSLPPGLRSHAK